MSIRTARRGSTRAFVPGVATAALVGILAGCGGDGGEDDTPASSSRAPDVERDYPSELPTARSQLDFAARVNGPISARPGDVATFTLSNVGRRRDSYGITLVPADAGFVAPRHLSLRSGRSAKFRVKVGETPLVIKVESAGAGGFVDAFTIQ